ncbi:HEAT repeat domain-containing protein [Salibacterium halotolerans]|uniref:HEAT repeat n=1 Tax=Salibacterium halotolerans TaxID=1884432 RepID=A0A1I5W5N2_9BACI|nr:HEAT repeat domain-containing protein [Salibacterium halotolerans]SFQ15064.1 HEAT repeat [Salibacterium halotolerans]
MFINLQAAYWMIAVLITLMIILMGITLGIKVNKKLSAKKENDCLDDFHSYLYYLQVQLDNQAMLRPPKKTLSSFEKKVLQNTLLPWIERLKGVHREKLLTLCEDIGLNHYNKRRLQSPWSMVRLDAAYNLGILRDQEVTSQLMSLLYRSNFDSSVYIIARSIAQTSDNPGEIKDLVLYLVNNGKQHPHLIADISKESSLDLRPVYIQFLYEDNSKLNKIGLIGLQEQVNEEIPEIVHSSIKSEDKEIRMLALQLCMSAMALTEKDVKYYLQFPDWEIRNLFADWIGYSGLIQYTELLKERIQDSNWIVSRTTAKSLAQLGEHGFEILCQTAAGVHGERGRETAEEYLKEKLKQTIDNLSQVEDITEYNQKVFMYQKYFGKSYDLINAL